MDLAQAKAFFDQFDPETRVMLLQSGSADITEWTERLIGAWQAGEAEGQKRAHHSLKGLCENFGAHTLLVHCERDLSDPAAADTLREYRDLTLRMLGEVAHGTTLPHEARQ